MPNFILKIEPIGDDAVGVVLPPALLNYLRVSAGDLLLATETASGGVALSPCDPDFAAQIELAERVINEDRDALRKLAR